MRQTVLDQFFTFTIEFESSTDFLYCDVHGLVTIGPGLLVDPRPMVVANGIEFRHPDGEIASLTEVEAAWDTVKAHRALGKLGGGQFGRYTSIRATTASLERAAQRKLVQLESGIRRFFPGWDLFPAPGQLLILSMGWAMGPGGFFHFPRFCTAVNAGHWADVAVPYAKDSPSCQMNEHNENASFRFRNAANLELAKRAVLGLAGGDVDELDVVDVILAARTALAAGPGTTV